jgi:hypothetical protein
MYVLQLVFAFAIVLRNIFAVAKTVELANLTLIICGFAVFAEIFRIRCTAS